jgi:hypothetical protein
MSWAAAIGGSDRPPYAIGPRPAQALTSRAPSPTGAASEAKDLRGIEASVSGWALLRAAVIYKKNRRG